jgi:hypothetical protein
LISNLIMLVSVTPLSLFHDWKNGTKLWHQLNLY